MTRRVMLIAAHWNYDDALDDLIEYRALYPQRSFELELCDDGHKAPWRVILRIQRWRPWQRWAFSKRRSIRT
jgi:hypothetical protein